MQCDWNLKTIQFDCEGTPVHLTGVRSDKTPAITTLDAAQLWQMHEAKEIWDVDLVDMQALSPHNKEDPIFPVIQQVLTEFRDVFEEPTTLPPHRQYDHAINLEPRAVPVNCRPYRYSPCRKMR